MLNVAIIGLGGISGAHLSAWLDIPEARITALCDVRPEQMEGAAKQTGAVCYTDYEELLDKERIDIVDICLPTWLHVPFALKALERGIHVLVEKPVSLHREDVGRLYRAAQERGARFMVAHVIRFWDEYVLLGRICREELYGKLLSGSMYRLNHTPGRSFENWMKDGERSGLVPYDLHIHDLDFLIHTFGTPRNVIRHTGRGEGQDYLNAVYEYDGFFVTAEASWYKGLYPFQAGFRFQFEHALAAYEKNEMVIYQEDGQILRPAQGEGKENGLGLPASNAYFNEIRYFTDCVLKGCPADKVPRQELETVIDLLNSFYA